MKYNWSKVPSIPAIFRILKKNIEFEDKELSNVFFDALEDFLYYGTILGYIKSVNFKAVLSRIIKIRKVGYLMPVLNEKKSINVNDKTRIAISNDLGSSERKYFMLKEIIASASSISSKSTREIAKDYLLKKGVYGEEKNLEDIHLEKGFRLIEDGIIYDMTENIYYASKKERRPLKTKKSEKKVLGRTTKFISNFKYHPSFQELTIMIGRSILSDKKLSDEEILKIMGFASLGNNFSNRLFFDLRKKYGDDVYDVIGKLGIIYKKETDVYDQNLIKDTYLKVVHAKRAYKDIINYVPEEKKIGKVC